MGSGNGWQLEEGKGEIADLKESRKMRIILETRRSEGGGVSSWCKSQFPLIYMRGKMLTLIDNDDEDDNEIQQRK